MITIEDKIYLTVKEFAEEAKVSDKNIYQQVKTRLEPYTKEIQGAIMIDKAAIEVFYSGIQPGQVNLNKVDLKLEQEAKREAENKYLTYLEQEIKEYKEQIKEKDKTIKELQEQVIKLSNESLQQIARITNNIQLLEAAKVQENIIKSQEEEIIEEPKKSWFDKIRGK